MTSELTSLIISHLITPSIYNTTTHVYDHSPISTYAAVSKEWQESIERTTFSRIKLTPSRLEYFRRFVCGPRRKYVRYIELNVVLEAYDEEAWGRVESEEEQARNNEIFIRTFQMLFKIMGVW